MFKNRMSKQVITTTIIMNTIIIIITSAPMITTTNISTCPSRNIITFISHCYGSKANKLKIIYPIKNIFLIYSNNKK